jgi:hypothetical protein
MTPQKYLSNLSTAPLVPVAAVFLYYPGKYYSSKTHLSE